MYSARSVGDGWFCAWVLRLIRLARGSAQPHILGALTGSTARQRGRDVSRGRLARRRGERLPCPSGAASILHANAFVAVTVAAACSHEAECSCRAPERHRGSHDPSRRSSGRQGVSQRLRSWSRSARELERRLIAGFGMRGVVCGRGPPVVVLCQRGVDYVDRARRPPPARRSGASRQTEQRLLTRKEGWLEHRSLSPARDGYPIFANGCNIGRREMTS